MKTKLVLCFLFATFISGCMVATMSQLSQKSITSPLAPGMSRIFLEREYIFAGSAIEWDIYDNYQRVGKIAVNGTLTWDRPSGIMNLALGSKADLSNLPFVTNVSPGFQYLIKATIKMEGSGFWSPSIPKAIFTLVSRNKISDNYYSPAYASNTPKSKIIIPSPEVSKKSPEKEEKQVSLKVSPLETEKNKGNDLPSIQFGRYHALIIGNNDYEFLPKLKTAKNDSQTVANILKDDYGFNVTLLLDAKRSDILLSLGKLRESLNNQDNLLIYYAGHGWLDKDGDEGYWLPVDATSDNEINWISNTSITTQLRAMEAKHVLIVADSCYSGKLGRSVLIQKRTPDYYSRLAQKRARIVIASGGLEPIIDSGGKGNHSVFASAFIEALQENQNFIDTSDLFNKIRRPVMLNADQTPEYADIRKAGHDGGEFIFIRKK